MKMICLDKLQRELAYFLGKDLRDLPRIEDILKAQGYAGVDKGGEKIYFEPSASTPPKPTKGTESFGENYAQFYHKPKEALAHLLETRSGQVRGAFHRDDIGDITLAWGEEGSGKSDGWGLAKIVKYHPEAVDKLDELVQALPIVKESPNRYQLENEQYKMAIRKDFEGEKENWILTAFEKDESIARRRTDLPSTENTEAKKTTLANTHADSTTTPPKKQEADKDEILRFGMRVQEIYNKYNKNGVFDRFIDDYAFDMRADGEKKAKAAAKLKAQKGFTEAMKSLWADIEKFNLNDGLGTLRHSETIFFFAKNNNTQSDDFVKYITHHRDKHNGKLPKSESTETFTDSKGNVHEIPHEVAEVWKSTFGLKSLDDEFVPAHSQAIQEALNGKEVKLTKGSLYKLIERGREKYIPQVKEALEKPEMIIKDGEELIFAKSIKDDLYLASVGKDFDTHITIISNAPKTQNTINNKIKQGEIIYKESAEALPTSGAFTETNQVPFSKEHSTTTPPKKQESDLAREFEKAKQNDKKGKLTFSDFISEHASKKFKMVIEDAIDQESQREASGAISLRTLERNKTALFNKHALFLALRSNRKNAQGDIVYGGFIAGDKRYFKTFKAIKPKPEEISALREEIEQLHGITPIAEFGTNYAEHYHSPKTAIEKLLIEKQGQVAGAFYKEGLGDIDLVWGSVQGKGSNAKGYGLAKILEKHLDDFTAFSGASKEEKLVNGVSEIVENGKLITENGVNTIWYKKDGKYYPLGLSKGFNSKGDNNWVVTSYEKTKGYIPNEIKGDTANLSAYSDKFNPTLTSADEPLKSIGSANKTLSADDSLNELQTFNSTAKDHSTTNSLTQWQNNLIQEGKSKEFVTDLANWHKDSHSITKNDDGSPKVFYHGNKESNGKLTIFEPRHTSDTGKDYPATFFSTSKDTALSYTREIPDSDNGVYSVYLKIENPLIIDFKGKTYIDRNEVAQELGERWFDLAVRKRLESAKQSGKEYDGVVFQNIKDNRWGRGEETSDTIAVFSPNQIKSIDNKGSYTDSKGNITAAKPKDTEAEHKYFNESSPNIMHSNAHIGSGLLSGGVAGVETDENGNITGFNPTKFALGFLGGAAGSKSIERLAKNPKARAVLERIAAKRGKNMLESASKMAEKYTTLNTGEARKTIIGVLENKGIIGNTIKSKDGVEAKISKNSIGKMVSDTAIAKSIDNGFSREKHLWAVENIEAIYQNAILKESRGDKKGNGLVIHRLESVIDEKSQALITLKESVSHGRKIYTIELQIVPNRTA